MFRRCKNNEKIKRFMVHMSSKCYKEKDPVRVMFSLSSKVTLSNLENISSLLYLQSTTMTVKMSLFQFPVSRSHYSAVRWMWEAGWVGGQVWVGVGVGNLCCDPQASMLVWGVGCGGVKSPCFNADISFIRSSSHLPYRSTVFDKLKQSAMWCQD